MKHVDFRKLNEDLIQIVERTIDPKFRDALKASADKQNTDLKNRIDRYKNALLEILDNPNYSEMCKNCRNKVINGFSINDMVQNMDNEIISLISEGTKVSKEALEENKDVYGQYLALYNQCDWRDYARFSENPRYEQLRTRLWDNPLYRAFIKFLKATGIMNLIKKTELPEKIKNKVNKN